MIKIKENVGLLEKIAQFTTTAFTVVWKRGAFF